MKNLKERGLHIRISKDFENELISVARSYGFAPSSFARAILEQNLPQYTRNRMFG